MACSSLPGLKRTALPGVMLTSVPVRGLRPIPVLRARTLKTPNPRSSMRSPAVRACLRPSKTVSTAVSALVRAIANRDVSRQYLALVHGSVPVTPFTVQSSIGRDPVSRVRMAVAPSGKPARTDVQPLLHGREGLRYSAVRCILHTGRTHQIRVHLSSRGYPLVADAVYGGANALGMQRQALHAARLAFAHPDTGQPLVFESPLPADMRAAWAKLAADADI